jgi:hypothetical protein
LLRAAGGEYALCVAMCPGRGRLSWLVAKPEMGDTGLNFALSPGTSAGREAFESSDRESNRVSYAVIEPRPSPVSNRKFPTGG